MEMRPMLTAEGPAHSVLQGRLVLYPKIVRVTYAPEVYVNYFDARTEHKNRGQTF